MAVVARMQPKPRASVRRWREKYGRRRRIGSLSRPRRGHRPSITCAILSLGLPPAGLDARVRLPVVSRCSPSLPRFLPANLRESGERCSSRLSGPKRGLCVRLSCGALLVWRRAPCFSGWRRLTPASAQYGRPTMNDPPIGEKYHVEVSYGFWNPDLEATISSEQLGIIGTEIDVKSDLGYTDEAIRQFRLVLRPGRKHKFRIEYIPIKFEDDTILNRTIVFNGIEFNAGLPVQSAVRVGHLASWLRIRLRLHRPLCMRDSSSKCGRRTRSCSSTARSTASSPRRAVRSLASAASIRVIPGEELLDHR